MDNGHLPQRGEPPFGFTSRLRRETRLQRWIHRKAVSSRWTQIIYLRLSACICGSKIHEILFFQEV
ncbi:hypothetical protein [Mastigocladopsis repens]|uniref:hypothetical protein n=1 Tax=Mastigocladopsis repens TaxID=221287 RepID=UPI0002DAF7EF|nr:hypothetical protein [Mastigocladopsis repens]